jgi:hypothetical protein
VGADRGGGVEVRDGRGSGFCSVLPLVFSIEFWRGIDGAGRVQTGGGGAGPMGMVTDLQVVDVKIVDDASEMSVHTIQKNDKENIF